MALSVLFILIAIVAGWWLLRWGWILIRSGGALWYLAVGMNPTLSRCLYKIEVLTERYPHGNEGLLPYRVYRPLIRSVAPALVIYHGATPYGEEHPALDRLARALAHAGLIVFVPRLPRLQAVLIDETNLYSMRVFYRYIQGHDRVLPGHISVAGTSFAGGLLLKALLDQDMQQPQPRAVLAYGSYCDLETTLRFVLTGKRIDDGTEVSVQPDRWAQVIFFYNYLDYIPGDFDKEAVRAVLDYYVRDQVEEGDKAKEKLSSAERRITELIITPGNPESSDLAETVLQHARRCLEDLSPSFFHSRIRFPFWVLHGRNDLMVPYTEALALKNLLPRQVRLYITNLYSHKHLDYGDHLWRAIRDIVGLLTYFGRFLRAVGG
ncbi:MAG: hypothetical protein JSW54_13475 [Fidelibacterota bacterium]|nr:MAG: hypothetical protein JSW54_13475 [Candidatus Neomarinimicrobiota bacterium]